MPRPIFYLLLFALAALAARWPLFIPEQWFPDTSPVITGLLFGLGSLVILGTGMAILLRLYCRNDRNKPVRRL